MPKIKTHKGVAKRVKKTGTNKILRERAFGGHLLSKKSKSRKRVIKKTAEITGSIRKNIKRALGV